jgi:uncharacterized protein YndB with AHSA1/START domain
MPTDTGRTHAAGTLEVRDDGRFTLRFERTLGHPPERVWGALTEPKQLREWFPTDIEGERKLGAKIRFAFREDAPKAEGDMHELLEHDPEDLDGQFTEFDPPRLLAYTWGDEDLRWELEPSGEGSLLTFTHTFDERSGVPHPAGPRMRAARDASGWEVCLDTLEALLGGTEPPAEDKWEGLYERYGERFAGKR